jgi:hypothetical protein
MKTRIIVLLSMLLVSLSAIGQEWIGKQFTLDTIVNTQCLHQPKNLNLLKSRIQGNAFYFVEQQGYQYKENGYNAVIHKLSLDNYEQTEIMLPIPESLKKPEHNIRNLWIYDFCFDGDYLLVTTQETLILYKQINNQNYQVVSTFSHHNLYMGYLHQNKIHFFEEDHDRGFKWFQQDLESDMAVLVRELPYEAPHIVQIQPNRYISHNQQSVFFLSTRFPRLEVYSLDGQLQDTIHFDIPSWKAFEDDYIRKTLSIPYGIERIFTVKDDLFKYSYPKVIMPLNGDLLLLFTNYDTVTGNSVLQYAIRKTDGNTVRYVTSNHEDSVYVAAQFPFTLFKDGLDKTNASGDDVIVQLTLKTDVPWQGKSEKDYLQDENRFYLSRTPSLAYKIMRYAPSVNAKVPILLSVTQDTVRLENLPTKKNILILHQDIECSGCVNAIYQLLNQTERTELYIGHVYPHPIDGLASYELKCRIGQHLHHPSELLYDNSANFSDLSLNRHFQESDFPCIILCDNNRIRKWFTLSDIFSSDLNIAEFNPAFLESWKAFISGK